MALDPDIRAALDRIAAQNLPALWEVPVPVLRANRLELLRDVERVAVGQVEDMDLHGPAGELPVRLYRPSASSGPLPLLVFLHGGGFVLGDIASYDPVCRRLCAHTPALVLSVDYRLAPEHRYPAAVEDAHFAVRWALQHARDLGADAARVVVLGDSAGGNLTAVVANELRGSGLPALAGQALIYPVIDLRDVAYPSRDQYAEGYGLTMSDMDWFLAQYAPDRDVSEQSQASPIVVDDLRGLPPTLVITAEYDPLRSEGEVYARRLAEAGVVVDFERLLGANHGVLANPEGFAAGERLRSRLTTWVREAMRTR